MDLRVLMQTDLVSVLPHLPAVKAVEVMEEWGFRHFPVVDENNLLVGVVSHVDLLRNRGHLASLTIFDVMTRTPLVLEPSDSVAKAAGLMATHKVSCIPLMEDGKLVGIVTTIDLLNVLARM